MYLDALDKEVYPAFVLFFLLIILLWTHFINNSLNQSPYFDYKHRFRPYKLMYYLVIALTAVLVFEYLTVGLHYGPTVANRSLLKASINGSFMILVLALGLSRIELKKGDWGGLRWQHVLPYNRTEEGRIKRSADRKYIIDSPIHLSANAYKPQMKDLLSKPLEAKITRQVSLSIPGEKEKDPLWYLVHAASPLNWTHGLQDQFLIKFKSKDEFNRKGESLALLLAIPEQDLLEAEVPSRDQFHFLGWIRILRFQSFSSDDKKDPGHP